MPEELKTCPFCGSEDIVIVQMHGYSPAHYAMCRRCCATTRSSIDTDEAVAHWNIRANDGADKCRPCAEMASSSKP